MVALYQLRSIPLLLAGVATLCGCVMPRDSLPVVPAGLIVPETQKLLLRTRAVGVQIYRCEPDKEHVDHYAWMFKAPEATLSDLKGKEVATHFAGPWWRSHDGSEVRVSYTAEYWFYTARP